MRNNQFTKAKKEGRRVTVSEETKQKLSLKLKGKPMHSLETKARISQKVKDWYQDNPGKHPWKDTSKRRFISVPCERVKDLLRRKAITFVEEFQPFTPEKFYSIDIAFPNCNLAIEINGSQHYTPSGELKPYYQSRNDFIKSKGWDIHEFHYTIQTEKIVEDIERLLEGKERMTPDEVQKWMRLKQEKKLEQIALKRLKLKETIQKKNELVEKRIFLIRNSDIGWNKMGWVEEVKALLGVSHTQVIRWMIKYTPDLLEKAWKRKRPSKNN